MLNKTSGPADSKMFFLGESAELADIQAGQPYQNLLGAGKTFNLILSQNGINRREVRVRYLVPKQVAEGNAKSLFHDSKCTLPKPELVEWIENLRYDLEEHKPNVIVAMGWLALWALTGIKKISEVRGYTIPCRLVQGIKVVATSNPTTVKNEWKLFPISVFDVRKALYHSEFSNALADPTSYEAPASYEVFMDYLETLRAQKKRIAFDIESHIGTAYPYLLGIADSPTFGMSFYNMKNNQSTMTVRQEAALWQKLAQVAKECESIMHNVSYDKAVMWHHHGVLFENVYMDTLIASHVIWPEFPRNLGFLGSILLDVAPWKNLSKVDPAVYNVLDAIRTFAIAEPLMAEIKKQKLEKVFEFEMSMLDPAIMMQLRGIKCDLPKREKLITESKELSETLKLELDTQFGRKINFNSPKQVIQLLYFDLKLEPQFKRRKSKTQARVMTVDKKSITRLARMYPKHTWLQKIIDYKKHLKLLNFLEAEPSPEGRYHTSYNITGSSKEEEGRKSFGRWSSSESIILTYGSGNLQNIPPVARKMYRADEGKILVQADMKQAEAVVVSHLIGDIKLQHFFKKAFESSKEEAANYDVHKLTASLMFNIPYEQVTPETRRIGKTLRHACSYSAGPQVVADQLGVELRDAKKLLELYHKSNPLLKVWYNSIQNELKMTRCLTTPLGRKHRFLDLWGDSLFRSAYSFKPQSTVGDFLNQSMRILYDKHGNEIDIMMQLHDAIYVQCDDDKETIDRTMNMMHDCMVRPIKIGFEEFIIEVDFKTGYIWGDLDESELTLDEEMEDI